MGSSKKTQAKTKTTGYGGKGYFVTSISGGQPINKAALKTALHYCKLMGYTFKVIETPPMEKEAVTDWGDIPIESRISYNSAEIKLNDNCKIWPLFSKRPQADSPTNGISAGTEESIIVGSAKQTSVSKANMSRLPRSLISTGSLCCNVYPADCKGEKARVNHFMGGYIIEVLNDKTFFPFNVKFLSDGSFVDRGVRFTPTGKRIKLKASEIVRVDGDDHAAEIDKRISNLLDRVQTNHVNAHCKISHDTWSQRVSNHHNLHENITQAQAVEDGFFKVDQEIDVTRQFLIDKSNLHGKVVVVPSNHNEAFDRMLQDGRYIEGGVNWLAGHVCGLAKYCKVDPVQFATAHYSDFMRVFRDYMEAIRTGQAKDFKLSSKTGLEKVLFLKQGQSFKFGGFELGHHGDDGSNGAKGSPKAMREIHVASVSGHTHTPWLYNNTVVVGTSTPLPDDEEAPEYCKGKPSGWMNTFAFVYQIDALDGEGAAQMCNIIDYEWQIENKKNK
jgi:hypothetical protein